MRYKTVEVTPFELTYRAYNKATGEYHGEFVRLLDAVGFVQANFTRAYYFQPAISFKLSIESDVKYAARTNYNGGRITHDYVYTPATPWVIVSEAGVVSEEEVKAAQAADRTPWNNNRWDERNRRYAIKGARLTRKKGSGDKVKANCEQVPYTDLFGDLDYSNLARSYYRRIKTAHETRWNEAHENEYGPGIVRASRNKHNLPNAWDDIYSGMYKTEDNWKHHSKRRKQWKPK